MTGGIAIMSNHQARSPIDIDPLVADILRSVDQEFCSTTLTVAHKPKSG